MKNWMEKYDMIRFLKPYFEHADARGSIRGLVNEGHWEELNLIRSDAGAVRGNHYHERTEELFIILEGRIKITLQRVAGRSLAAEQKECEVKAGDVFLIEKNVNHVFEILEPSSWINALSARNDPGHSDICRL